jgi:hypothetical protein
MRHCRQAESGLGVAADDGARDGNAKPAVIIVAIVVVIPSG